MLKLCSRRRERHLRPNSTRRPQTRMTGPDRDSALARIRANIAGDGLHVYTIFGGPSPRFSYSIGVSETFGHELIFAGGTFYLFSDAGKIVDQISAALKMHPEQRSFELAGIGSFTLRKSHTSWSNELMLGVSDYYRTLNVPALQIVPGRERWTIDVPDMSNEWSPSTEPVWRWMKEPWTFSVPGDSTVATHLAVLRGERVTEVARLEESRWGMSAGSINDVPDDDLREVPLGTLIAVDESLIPTLNLAVEQDLVRDYAPGSRWEIER
jgi:hypothetical protein